MIWDALRDKLAEKPWATATFAALAIGLFAIWFFGWNKPSRSDVEGFLSFSFTTETSLEAFGEDGSELTIQKSSLSSIGDVDCRGESKRKRPSITYDCFYTLIGPAGARFSLVLTAVHNRGWKRHGMASVGNYWVSTHSAETQRKIFDRHGVELPIGQADETGNP